MRKTILSIAAALSLAISGSALAAFDFVGGGSHTGASVSSGAFASSSNNGSVDTMTGGYQQAVGGFRGSSSSSYRSREGHVTVEGIAGAQGDAGSRTVTSGNGIGGSGTLGYSEAGAGGGGFFDTHRDNPEGWAIGGAGAENVNKAGTFSYGNGGALRYNESGTLTTFRAHAEGNRDGGYRGRPTTDYVATDAAATSEGYRSRQSRTAGNGVGLQWADTSGWSFGAAHAEAGDTESND